MPHLLLGINPIELGGAPFALASDGAIPLWATEIDLHIHPNARIFVLPCIAGHVGADTAGGVLAGEPRHFPPNRPIVGVGTPDAVRLGKHHLPRARPTPTATPAPSAPSVCRP